MFRMGPGSVICNKICIQNLCYKVITFCACMMLFFSCARDGSKIRQQALEQWMVEDGKLKVLSTISMINDLVKQIGGEYVDSLTLIQGELDPHSYQLVKGDGEKFLRADLIFYNGLGLEHGASLQSHLQGSEKAIPLANKVQEVDFGLILFIQGQVDPHIWMDVSLWAKTIPFIVEALSKKDPVHSTYYAENGEIVRKNMMQVHENIISKMQAIPENKRYLVTSHDAFNYFARAYLATHKEFITGQWHERFMAPEGLAPESQLSTRDLQLIIDHLRIYHIHVLFPETNVSKDSIRKIIEAGTHLGLNIKIANNCLYGDAMGPSDSDGGTYIKMMEYNAQTIAHYWNEPKGEE